jgi:hypothetical protein
MFGHTTNGTTLAMSKKGSGVAAIINPWYGRTRRYPASGSL